MTVDGRFGDADLRRDLLNRQMFTSVLADQITGCINDLPLPDISAFPFNDHDSSPVWDVSGILYRMQWMKHSIQDNLSPNE